MHIGIHGIHWIHRGYMRCTVNSFLHAGLRSLGKLPPNIVAHPSLPVRQEMVGMMACSYVFQCISYLIILCFMCLTSSHPHALTPGTWVPHRVAWRWTSRAASWAELDMSDSVIHVQHVPKCKRNEHPVGQHVLHECYVAIHYQRCDALQNLLDIAATLWNLSNFPPALFGTFQNFREPFETSKGSCFQIPPDPPTPQLQLNLPNPSFEYFRNPPQPSSCEPLWWPLNCLGKTNIGPPSSNRDSKFTSHDSIWFILIHDISWFPAWTLKVRSWRPQPVAQFRAFGTTTRQECRTLWMPQAQTKQCKKKHDSLAMNYDVDLHCALLINLSIDLHA